MKIAINRCFGGFNLSHRVFEELIKLGVSHYKNYKEIPKNNKDPYIIDSDSTISGKYYSNLSDYENRTNPLLIQAIEKIGEEESSGRFGEIKIIEIPDGINWEIEDYDGIETVNETHRSW
jgi:hypothetical protein